LRLGVVLVGAGLRSQEMAITVLRLVGAWANFCMCDMVLLPGAVAAVCPANFLICAAVLDM